MSEGVRPQVLALADTGLYRSLQEIATAVGVSRERVRQILNTAGRRKVGHDWFRTPLVYYAACGHQVKVPGIQRCATCLHEQAWISLTCEVCGVQFQRRAFIHRRNVQKHYGHVACSRQCWGHFAGMHFGWPAQHGSNTHESIFTPNPHSERTRVREGMVSVIAMVRGMSPIAAEQIAALTGAPTFQIEQAMRQVEDEEAWMQGLDG